MTTIIIIFILTFLLIVRRHIKSKRLPRGPYSLPFVGSLPFLTRKRGFLDWGLDKSVTDYKLATVGLGARTVFIINDLKLAKDLFGQAEFSGKGNSAFHLEHRGFDGKPQGIINTQEEHWATQRRFALRTLKDFGFGKNSIEDAINTEVDEFIGNILQTHEEDYLLGSDFNVPFINVLWQMVASSRFTPDDPEGMEMVKMVNKIFTTGVKMTLLPLSLMKKFPEFTEYKTRVDIYEVQKKYIIKTIEEHKENIDSSNPRDFIDVYLNEIEKGDPDGHFNDKDLALCMMDFLHAGTETSSTTLKWIILYLTIYSEIQERCRQELVKYLGCRTCQVSDMPHLPYLQATITEVQRMSSVTPFSLSHQTLRNTKVDGGYTFPKGSVFMINLRFIMNNPSVFDKPDLFQPDRFLGQDGGFEKIDECIPFSVGKRHCLGESLARNEMFLFTASLIQRVKFLQPENHPTPNPSNYTSNLTSIPDDFFVRFKPVNE